jgi:hypothetical protein
LAGIDLKRRPDLFLSSSFGEPDGIGSHDFTAGTNTEPAKDAIVFGAFTLEGTLFNTHVSRELLNEWNLRTSRQEKLDQNAPCLNDSGRMGLYLDSFTSRIVAGCDHSGLSIFRDFYGAKPARAVRCKVRMIAEGRNGDGPLPADF